MKSIHEMTPFGLENQISLRPFRTFWILKPLSTYWHILYEGLESLTNYKSVTEECGCQSVNFTNRTIVVNTNNKHPIKSVVIGSEQMHYFCQFLHLHKTHQIFEHLWVG